MEKTDVLSFPIWTQESVWKQEEEGTGYLRRNKF